MIVEFFDINDVGMGSVFHVNMYAMPLLDTEIDIHKSLLPTYYFEGEFIANPLDDIDDCVSFTVFMIKHIINENREHVIQICTVPAYL